MKTNNVEREIEQTLSSLSGMEERKAPVDFYAKLEKRLSFVEQKHQTWLKRLQLGVAAMLIMSLLNVYLFVSNTNVETENTENNEFSDFSEAYFDTISLIAYDDE